LNGSLVLASILSMLVIGNSYAVKKGVEASSEIGR